MSLSEKVLAVLRQIAPVLATAAGGPLAGAAVKTLSGVLLAREDGSPQDVETALLSATPEVLLRVREADHAFALRMRELDIDLERLATQDRASARELGRITIWPQISLSALFVGGYFAVLVVILSGVARTPAEWQSVLTTILGVLSAGVPQVLSYWFGSTSGSAAKTAALASSRPA